jgi:hypothetical protein
MYVLQVFPFSTDLNPQSTFFPIPACVFFFAYRRVPFPHLKRHPVCPVIPPFVVIEYCLSLFSKGVGSLIDGLPSM